MASTLLVTKELKNDHWLITMEIQPGGTLPPEIFVYTNTGTSALGEFYGVCSVDELTRLQKFVGVEIPMFGNKYVKYGSAKIKIDLATEVQPVIDATIANIRSLSIAYQAQITSTTTYTIV